MTIYFVYKVLTNRIRALIIAAGYIIPGSPRLHNFNVRVPERGSLGTRLSRTSLGLRTRHNAIDNMLVKCC